MCNGAGECNDVDGREKHVVLCSANFVQGLDRFIRLVHDGKVLTRVFGNDAAVLDFMAASKAELPEVEQQHLALHWSSLFKFVLGHELGHIRDATHDGTLGFSAEHGVRTTENRNNYLAQDLACLNDQEFKKLGLAIQRIGPSAKEGVGSSPSAEVGETGGTSNEWQDSVATARKVWRDELAADDFAISLLRDGYDQVADDVAARDEETMALLYAQHEIDVTNVALVAMWDWYTQLAVFLRSNCPEKMSASFPLTRCMCTSESAYSQGRRLLGETHAPLFLRASRAVEKIDELIFTAARMSREESADNPPDLSGNPQPGLYITGAQKTFQRISRIMMGAPARVSFLGCAEPTNTRPVGMYYPALEGIVGHSGSEGPGYPNDDQKREINRECHWLER